MVVLNQGKMLSPGDLFLCTREGSGAPVMPFQMFYSIFQMDGNGGLILASAPKVAPIQTSPGVFHVGGTIPTNWEGKFRLTWYLMQYPDSTEVQIHEDFEVVRIDPITTSFDAPSMLMTSKPGINRRVALAIVKVREHLSDTNPERDYHFRPPTEGRVVAGFNDRVGFIWTDRSIVASLRLAMAEANTWNPMNLTSYTVENAPKDWVEAIALGAAAKCLSKEAVRWSADGFSYSLNGVSLDLNKYAEYQSLANDYASEFKEWLPLLTANRPCVMGVRQQRWLLG